MNFLERQLEDPLRFARIKRWFYVGLAVVALSEIVLLIFNIIHAALLAEGAEALAKMFPGDHSHFWFERFPAWGSLYGLASCVAIIVVSKLLGKVWLMRREDYYDS